MKTLARRRVAGRVVSGRAAVRRIAVHRIVVWGAAAYLAAAPASLSAQLGGPAEKVVVTGSADVVTTVEAARERALQQAFRLAVEQVAGVLVESETLSRNLALFEDNILTRTDGYVRRFEVLDQREEEGAVMLEVEVEVVAGPLSGDLKSLGILLRRADYPLVSVELFASSNAELPPDVGPRLEAEVRSVLKSKGLEVVEPNGRGLDAVVRIEGTLEWSDLGDPTGLGMQSAMASVSMQAIEDATGSVLTASRSRGRGAGVSVADARDRAGMQALDGAVDDLVDGLVDSWSSRVNNRDAVLLSVRGIDSFEQVTLLADAIENRFEETEDVVQRQVAVDRGTAFLEWRGRSNASTLARWLAGQDLGDFRVVVVGTGGNMVQLEIRRP